MGDSDRIRSRSALVYPNVEKENKTEKPLAYAISKFFLRDNRVCSTLEVYAFPAFHSQSFQFDEDATKRMLEQEEADSS